MKLYTLNLKGIGPFATPIAVDFRVFEDAGLFLLRGSTGSGKTTLLDAIVFALYGSVTKDAQKSEERLRSHYLRDTDRAEVELVFGTQSGIYRVVREPAYQKEGRAARTSAKASLSQVTLGVDSSFIYEKEIASGARQVNQELTQIIGLSREQFLQTIILPQGRFAEFLSAQSKDRQQILQSIFGTERFETYQEMLIGKGKDAKKAIDSYEAAVSSAYEQAKELYSAAHLEVTSIDPLSTEGLATYFPPFPEEGALKDSLEVFDEHFNAVEKYFSDHLAQTQKTWDDARHAEDQARRALELFKKKEELEASIHRLDEAADDIAHLEHTLHQAQKAEPFSFPLAQAEQAWAELVSIHAQVVSALHKNTAFSSWWESDSFLESTSYFVEDAEAFASSSLSEALEEKGRLEPLVTVEKQLEEDAHILADKQSILAKYTNEVDTLRVELEALPQAIATAVESYNAAYLRAQGLEQYAEEHRLLRERVANAQEVLRLQALLPEYTSVCGKTRETAEKAHKQAEKLRAAWMSDSAASLAAELHEGDPCAVCGSTTHPMKAEPREDSAPVTRAMVEDAQEESRRADRKFEEAQSALHEFNAQISQAEGKAQGTFDELTRRYEESCIALQNAQEAQQSLDGLKQAQRDLEHSLSAKEEEIHQKEGEVVELRADISQSEKNLKDRQAQIADERGEWDSLGQRLSATLQRIEDLKESIQTLRSLTERGENWKKTAQQLETIMGKERPEISSVSWDSKHWYDLAAPLPSGNFITEILPQLTHAEFAGAVHDAHAALLPASAVEEGVKKLATYHESKRQHTAELAQEKYTMLSGEETALAAQAEQHTHLAQEKHQKALEASSSAAATLSNVRQALRNYVKRCEDLERQRFGSEALLRLRDLASGDSRANLVGIPLATWVLMSLFDEVLIAANTHLKDISHGRYELIRHSYGTDKRSYHGLDLMVMDYDVDRSRYPSTLSGGETFYVSLALALGLAEIVTGENGGMQLQSMFIDEGFGTLDPHTLDSVMEILHDLHQGDRLIGIISHVDDLAKRISEQIIVTKTDKNGSTITIRA